MKVLYARVEHPNNGYEGYKEAISKLDHEKFYEVKKVSMGQSSTSIMLEFAEVRIWLNSSNFEFYLKDDEGKYIPHNIFGDKDYNPYLAGLIAKD